MIVIWREYRGVSKSGTFFLQKPFYPQDSGKLLLDQLTGMTREGKVEIPYDAACDLVSTELCKAVNERNHDLVNLLMEQWVAWLSDLGFYVAFTQKDYKVNI